jgi:nicotinamidase-related amidase
MRRIIFSALAVALLPVTALAADAIEEWAGIAKPPAPALKPVTADAKTTALLMLDFMQQNCGKRERCVASVPAMKKLLGAARAANATVVYSFIANTGPSDVLPDVAPQASEPGVVAGPDKFRGTDLEKILKDKGIQTVIVTGTAADGAVLFTAAGAAFRGMNVVIPVDGMSSQNAYSDHATAFTFTTAPQLSARTTLTRSDQIKFQ